MALKLRKNHWLAEIIAQLFNSVRRNMGSITDPGHTHNSTAIVEGRHVRYEAPITADLTTNVATLDPIASGALSIAAQPDYPRKLQVRIVDTNNSVTGTLTLVGVGARGQALSQVIALTGGTRTVTTDDAFATITSATLASVAGAASGDTISIGPSTALGLPGPKALTPTLYAVYKSNVSNANEAVGTVDATAGTIIPTSVPNGTRTYDFWFNFSYTPAATASAESDIEVVINATSEIHLDASEQTVQSANASSLATSLTLVNELVAVYQRQVGHYPGHVNDELAHLVADDTNVLDLDALTYPATDLDEAIALANPLYTAFNAHLTQSGVHQNNDSTNTASSSTASDQDTLNTRLNNLKTKLNAHMASAPAGQAVRLIPG